MVVHAPDGLVSLTAAKTHKFVIITGIIAPEVLLGSNLFLVTKAADSVIEMIVNAMGAVILTVTRQTDEFTLNLLIKLLVILPRTMTFLRLIVVSMKEDLLVVDTVQLIKGQVNFAVLHLGPR